MIGKTRAKFRVENVDKVGDVQEDILLTAVCDGNPENQSFNKYTPYGELKMMVDNPELKGFFVQGKEYYLDFIPAE